MKFTLSLGVFAFGLSPLIGIGLADAATPYATLTASDLPPANAAAARPSPLQGFLTSPEWHAGGYAAPQYLNDVASTLEFYYVGLSDVMMGMADFPGFDSVVEPRVAASASRGKHAILRFYMDYPRPQGSYVSHTPQFLIDDYGLVMTDWSSNDLGAVGSSPDYADPNLVMALENFIAALGARYDSDTRVAYVQLGLLGFWGEWHTWTGDPATDGWIPDSTKMAVIDAYDAAFGTTQVQARYIHWHAVGRQGFGLHDDSFAHSTIDEGVYGQPVDWFFWSQAVNAGATDFWTLGPMGGELRPELQSTIFNADYPAGTQYKQDFGLCSETTHATYMLNYYAFATGYQGVALDDARAANDRMGYAFRIGEVSVADGVAADTVDVTATVIQDGIAPFYYDLGLRLACVGYVTTVVGADGLVAEGASATFAFAGVPSTSECLSAASFSLSSSYALPGFPVKFAQGTSDGTTVDVSLPLPWPTPPPTPAPVTAAPTGPPVSTVAKYLCNKREPLPATICAEGAPAGGDCAVEGASGGCGRGGKTCFWKLDCADAGPQTPGPTPAPVPAPPSGCPRCSNGDECCPEVGTCSTSGKPTNRACDFF